MLGGRLSYVIDAVVVHSEGKTDVAGLVMPHPWRVPIRDVS